MNEYNNELLARAEQLATLDYTVDVSVDTLSDGRRIFLLEHPELPGCMAQGRRIDAALAELQKARTAYLYHLLVTEQPVPQPEIQQTITGAVGAPVIASFSSFRSSVPSDEDKVVNTVIKPDRREHTIRFSVVDRNMVQHS